MRLRVLISVDVLGNEDSLNDLISEIENGTITTPEGLLTRASALRGAKGGSPVSYSRTKRWRGLGDVIPTDNGGLREDGDVSDAGTGDSGSGVSGEHAEGSGGIKSNEDGYEEFKDGRERVAKLVVNASARNHRRFLRILRHECRLDNGSALRSKNGRKSEDSGIGSGRLSGSKEAIADTERDNDGDGLYSPDGALFAYRVDGAFAEEGEKGNRTIEVEKRINGTSIICTIEQGSDKQLVATSWKFAPTKKAAVAPMPQSGGDNSSPSTPEPNAQNDTADIEEVKKDLAEIKSVLLGEGVKFSEANGSPFPLAPKSDY